MKFLLLLGLVWLGAALSFSGKAKQTLRFPRCAAASPKSNSNDARCASLFNWRKVCGAAAVAFSMGVTPSIPGAVPAAHAKTATVQELQGAIDNLEGSTDRAGVVQNIADLYEVAESKTLLVRTKYKYRIITAINDKRKMLGRGWDNVLSYESGELKRRVDPYRTVDLGGYLKVAPFVGGAAYLGALFIQQSIPELFTLAYPIAVATFALPLIFIVLTS